MINKKITLYFLTLLYCIDIFAARGWYTIEIKNMTKETLKGSRYADQSDVLVHTTQHARGSDCNDFWLGSDLKPGESYSDRQGSWYCVGACYDKFRVKDQEFYIPNHCSSSTIEVREDGVYLNGSRPRPYDCWKVPGWGLELAGIKSGMEAAIFSLKLAEGFLEKVGKPVATTGALAVRESGKGILVAGREISTEVLSSSEDMAEFLLTAIDIQKLHWDGNLQDMADGKMGNFQVTATIFKKDFSFNLDLDIHKGVDFVKNIAQKIVDKLKEMIDKMEYIVTSHNDFIKKDDMIKMALRRTNHKIQFSE